ncbi:hypothetical protein ABFU27_21210 [Xanthomonas campestris pv. raphani]|uniref:hypothetical protein n=2 Tax=Xanthomonas campestris TaxID=339 RepID=UPI002B22969C|nr:hypothetical protein [Xanthomonas campestris]MEA9861584.1 hypothetical protein [Xanthomonas campestris pv. raphani]MEA9942649.1 hypothetical protein [Xanthomonas campestris pv. raphani]
MTRARQHLIGEVREALEAYPAGPLPADAGEAAFYANALQRFDALAQARDVALPPGVSIAWSWRFGCTTPRCLQNRCRAHAASRAARRAFVSQHRRPRHR